MGAAKISVRGTFLVVSMWYIFNAAKTFWMLLQKIVCNSFVLTKLFETISVQPFQHLQLMFMFG